MNSKTVITIGRQFGSGGKEIGEKLAKELGIRCYDKELLAVAARRADFARNYLRIMMKNQQTVFCIHL